MHDSIIVRKDNQIRLSWVLGIFLALTFVCLVLLSRGVSSASRIGCYILIAFAVMLPTDELLCLIATVLPTGNIYKLGGGYTAIPFLMLIYIVKTFVKKRMRISSDAARPLIWAVVLFFVSAIATTIHNFSLIEIIPFYMHLVFVVVALQMNHINEEEKYTPIAFCFVIGTLMVCIGTIVFPTVSRSISNIGIYSRANPGFSSTWDFGRSLSISIAFVVVGFLKTKRRFLLNCVLVLIMLYFLIQCGRFSMLLGLGALLICIPFAYGTDKSLRQRVMYTTVMIIVMAIVSYILIRYVYSSMVELRGYGASENGRFDVWSTYFNYLSEHPLVVVFGVGGGAISSIASYLNTATAHNIVLEKLVEVGIVGFILFILFFITLYRRKTLNPTRNLNVLPLVAFLGTALTQGTTGNAAFALLLAMCASDIVTNKAEDMEVQNENKIYYSNPS